MVDLDSDPTKLIEISSRQTDADHPRRLTTFSIANDVAKYSPLSAMFVVTLPSLAAINIMRLSNPHSASCRVIFNALIIVALIPLALKACATRPSARPGS